jgi:hypothetical protein
MLKLYPKVGEKTAAEVWLRISQSVNPLDAFLRGVEVSGRGVAGSMKSARALLNLISSDSMKRNPSETIRLDRRARLRRLRAREVPERAGAARRSRTTLAVRAAL